MSAAVDVYRRPETLKRSSPNVNVTPQTLPTMADLLCLGEVTDISGRYADIFLIKSVPSAERSIESALLLMNS